MKLIESLLSKLDILDSKVPAGSPIASLTNRSDSMSRGACFFAIAGHQSDGHAFVASALREGAAAVVVEKPEIFAANSRTVLVSSTRHALGIAASRWHGDPSRQLKLVGITGTNGKTTTSFLLKSIWDGFGLKSGVIGTVEYHIGDRKIPSPLTTPDPLILQGLFAEMVEQAVGYAALEVSSIALDQSRVAGSTFESAIFTNLTQDHLDYHGDMASYYSAKRKLFSEYQPRCSSFNIDDPWGSKLFKEHSGGKLSFSAASERADFSVSNVEYGRHGTRAVIASPVGPLAFHSLLIGKHNLYNCLGALAAVSGLGLSLERAVETLNGASGAPGRLERVAGEVGIHPLVFVDYAHTDDALKNVLSSLHELRAGEPGRIVTVFGCGGDRDKSKRPLMAQVASQMSDVTIATSDNPRTENPNSILDDIERGILKSETQYHREVDRAAAIELALSLAHPEDLVLVAGKGHETYQILGHEKVPFDDREVILRFWRA